MVTKSHLRAALLCLLVHSLGFFAYAQAPADAVAEVPALTSFHEVIFKIWHEAWPQKNTALLKDLLPEVEAGVSNVASAKLPGILREKRADWEKDVSDLEAALEAYKAAAEADAGPRLMDAAEELHGRFEALMRLIQPPLKELEDFHSSLYMLYHHYLPEYDIEKIRSSADELEAKMQSLRAARLPEQLQDKKAEFEKDLEALSDSLDAFAGSLKTRRREAIKEAVEKMHADYQKVRGIFE
jgi:DNA repair exonuclease SbcCD ATPase subunit